MNTPVLKEIPTGDEVGQLLRVAAVQIVGLMVRRKSVDPGVGDSSIGSGS